MVIEENDFRLTQLSDSSNFWNLELKKKKKKKKVESDEEDIKIDAYGITLSTAIKKIVVYRISLKHIDESITMKEFLKDYKEEVEKIVNLCTEHKLTI